MASSSCLLAPSASLQIWSPTTTAFVDKRIVIKRRPIKLAHQGAGIKLKNQGTLFHAYPAFGEIGRKSHLAPSFEVFAQIFEFGRGCLIGEIAEEQVQWRIIRRDCFNNCFRGASGITRLVSVSFHRAGPRVPGGLVVIAQRLAGQDERSAEKISPKWTRFHDGDANSQRRDFFGQRLRKPLDCELGGVIDAVTSCADESPDGRKVVLLRSACVPAKTAPRRDFVGSMWPGALRRRVNRSQLPRWLAENSKGATYRVLWARRRHVAGGPSDNRTG